MAFRPIFLVIEVEQPEGLSSRKLVIETAKFNVLTAYSGAEGLQTLERVPAVNAVVVHAAIEDIACRDIVRFVKEKSPRMPVIVVSPNLDSCPGADYVVSAYDPSKLLEVLRHTTAVAS